MKKEKVKVIGEDKVMPHDIDTEQAVLATMMRYNEKFSEYSDMLNAEIFYRSIEKGIYRCIEGVINEGGITDINSLYNYARSHDVGMTLEREMFLHIYQLASTQTFDQDIRRLRDMSKRRLCWLMLQQAASNVLDLTMEFDEQVNGLMTSVGEVQAELTDDKIPTFDDALEEVRQTIINNVGGVRQYLTTGFKLFDDYYLLRPGTMTVIAAFTSVGKSALALNICMSVARQGVPVAYFSLEMGKAELASRGISKAMELPASVIMNRQLKDYQLQNFDKVRGELKHLPMYFDDRNTASFDRTIRSIRMMVKTKGIKLAVIDYLQIYGQVMEDAEQSISFMAREAKNISLETCIPVIVLSQLNRSALHPSLKMLRGSGQIEESADNIVLIDRPEAYPDNKVKSYEGEFKEVPIKGTAKLILAKGRGVGTASELVGFDGAHTRFFEIVKPEDASKHIEHDEELPF